MKPSQACLDLIRKSESCKLTAYLDSGGVPTIGIGHTGPEVHIGLTWTQGQADSAFQADVDRAARDVAKSARNCTQGQFDALTDFVFNLGVGNLASSTLLKLHNAGSYAPAAAEFGKWVHQGTQILAGLVKRRAHETLMYLGDASMKQMAGATA